MLSGDFCVRRCERQDEKRCFHALACVHTLAVIAHGAAWVFVLLHWAHYNVLQHTPVSRGDPCETLKIASIHEFGVPEENDFFSNVAVRARDSRCAVQPSGANDAVLWCPFVRMDYAGACGSVFDHTQHILVRCSQTDRELLCQAFDWQVERKRANDLLVDVITAVFVAAMGCGCITLIYWIIYAAFPTTQTFSTEAEEEERRGTSAEVSVVDPELSAA